jgi:hypothetical protein
MVVDTVDHSKREKRRQHVVELLARPGVPVAWPLCHCAAPAKYQVNRKYNVTFVCAEHVPEEL